MPPTAEQGRAAVELSGGAQRAMNTQPERGTFAWFAHPVGAGGAVLEARCGTGDVETGLIPRLASKGH